MGIEDISGVTVEPNTADSCNAEKIGSCCMEAIRRVKGDNEVTAITIDCPGYDQVKGCQGYLRAYDEHGIEIIDASGPIPALRIRNYSFSDRPSSFPAFQR
jgi:hypothetical protein